MFVKCYMPLLDSEDVGYVALIYECCCCKEVEITGWEDITALSPCWRGPVRQ